MDTDRLIDVAPHYAAMLILVYLALALIEITVGDLGFWTELVVIAAIVMAYRPVVMWLGVGPSAWEQE